MPTSSSDEELDYTLFCFGILETQLGIILVEKCTVTTGQKKKKL